MFEKNVTAWGFGDSIKLTSVHGKISRCAEGKDILELNRPVEHGFSGGPVCIDSSNPNLVVGISCAASESDSCCVFVNAEKMEWLRQHVSYDHCIEAVVDGCKVCSFE